MKYLLPYFFIPMFVVQHFDLHEHSNYRLFKETLKETGRVKGFIPNYLLHVDRGVATPLPYFLSKQFSGMQHHENDDQDRLVSTMLDNYGPEWKQSLVAGYFHIAHHVLMGSKGNPNDIPEEVYQAIDMLWITFNGLTAIDES